MTNRNYVIDFIKFIYSIIIVGLHSVYLMSDGIRRIFPHGYLCVEFFFIASGYLMASSAFDKDIAVDAYMFKKYKRLLPYIVFSWMVGATIIFFSHPEWSFEVHAQNFLNSIWHVLMLDLAGFNGYQVIGAFWYLSAMFLTMPILYYFIKKNLCTWGGDILASVFIYGWFMNKYGLITLASGEYYQITALLRAIAGMLMGCFCYRTACKLNQLEFTTLGMAVLTILEWLGYVVSFIIICRPWTGTGDTATFFIILAWAVSVSITFSQKSFSARVNEKTIGKYAEGISMFSTAIYLCHGRMQGLVVNVFPMLTSFKQRVVPYYIISIIVAIICVLFVKIFNGFFDKCKSKFVIT